MSLDIELAEYDRLELELDAVRNPEHLSGDPAIVLHCTDCGESFEGYFGWFIHASEKEAYPDLAAASEPLEVLIERGEEPMAFEELGEPGRVER